MIQIISLQKKKEVEEKEALISEFETKLAYGGLMESGIYKGKEPLFKDMMFETNKLLDITMPIKHYPNKNTNQSLY